MFRFKAHVRSISLFVIAFVCLNAGGAACVAYCQTFEVAAEPEHCPLKKLSEDCDKSESEESGPSVAVKGDETDCCPMTVSFVAAPVEKNTFTVKQPAPAAIIKAAIFRPEFSSISTLHSAISYRGPPPLDRRRDRIKHRLLLI